MAKFEITATKTNNTESNNLRQSSPRLIMSSLCFKDAYLSFKRGSLTEEEYVRSILMHFRGGHPDCDLADSSNFSAVLSTHNPYAESIRRVSLLSTYQPLSDPSIPLEDIFIACLNDEVEKVKQNLAKCIFNSSDVNLSGCLATLAAEKGHALILDFCLGEGVKFDGLLDRAIEIGFFKSLVMLDVLSKARWRDIQDAKGDMAVIEGKVRPWLSKSKKEDDRSDETTKERHDRLTRDNKHGSGTCLTGEELEKRFGWLDW